MYTQQWYMSYRSVDSFRAKPVVLLESCLQTCMTYTIAECTLNKLLVMDRRTVRNMQSFMTKINLRNWRIQLVLLQRKKDSYFFGHLHFYVQEKICFVFGATAPSGPWPPRVFQITPNDALSRQDSSGTVISPSQRPLPDNTFTTDKHPCPGWDSNPQPQQVSSRRPTPQTARPLGPTQDKITIFKSLLLAAKKKTGCVTYKLRHYQCPVSCQFLCGL